MNWNIAVTDWTFPDLGIEEGIARAAGAALDARPCRTAAELVALVAGADAVITQFARLDAEVIGAMRRARVIVRYGIGVDNVDLEAARRAGIPVCNVPDYCVDEVADQTLAFILAVTRQVVPNTLHVHGGRWGLATPLAGMQALRDLTVGIVGFGRIGREVAARLQPFKARVLVSDPVVAAEEIRQAGAEPVTFEELLSRADIVTPHCPSNAATRRMFNAAAFARLRRGAVFINVGRGDLADSAALVAALSDGTLAAAALDVFDPEPIPAGHPILGMPHVILSSHLASASPPAVKKLRESAAGLAVRALRGEPLPNVVNGVGA